MRSAWIGLLLLWGTASASERIYRWTDADGVVHYSNERNVVPDPARAETTEGEELGVLPSKRSAAAGADVGDPARSPGPVDGANPKDGSDERVAQAAVRRAEAEAARAEAEVELVRAQGEQRWRSMFQDARARLAALLAEQEEVRSQLTISGMPVTARFVTVVQPHVHDHHQHQVHDHDHAHCRGHLDPLRTYGAVPDPAYERARLRLKQLDREIAQARQELEDLERRASFAEVPRHWRR